MTLFAMKRTFGIVGLTAVFAAACCGGCRENGAEIGDDNEQTASAAKSSPIEIGAAALESEDWTRAYDAFTAALAADEKDVDAYFGRAAASFALAEERYNLAKAAATNEDVATGNAEAAKADEYFQKSLDDCEKILTLDPNYAEAYFLRGVAAQYQGAWNEGIEAFTKCVELAPERAEAYHRRGEIYDHIGDYMNSSVDFKKAAELGFGAEKNGADQTEKKEAE